MLFCLHGSEHKVALAFKHCYNTNKYLKNKYYLELLHTVGVYFVRFHSLLCFLFAVELAVVFAYLRQEEIYMKIHTSRGLAKEYRK